MSFAVVSSTLNWLQHININRDGYYTRSDEKWKIFLRFSPVSLNHQLISITPDRQRKWDRTRFPLIDYYYFCLCFFFIVMIFRRLLVTITTTTKFATRTWFVCLVGFDISQFIYYLNHLFFVGDSFVRHFGCAMDRMWCGSASMAHTMWDKK